MANRCGTNGCCSGSAALMPHQQSHTAADAQLCHVPQPVSIHNPAQDTAACRHPLRPNVSSYSSVHRSRPWAAAAALRVGYLLLLAAMLVPQVQARKRALQAAAQPCIECSQCLTAACQRICTPSCRAGRPGVAIALNGDQCRSRGEDAADSVADDACKSAQGLCQAGTKSAQQWTFQSGALVSSSVCAAIANGACTQAAVSSQNTPCGVYLYFGFRSCSGRQFSDVYRSRVVGLCKSATGGY